MDIKSKTWYGKLTVQIWPSHDRQHPIHDKFQFLKSHSRVNCISKSLRVQFITERVQ